jgi:hypothetical protein
MVHNTTKLVARFWSVGEFTAGPDVKTGPVVGVFPWSIPTYILTIMTHFAIAVCQDEQFIFGIEHMSRLLTRVQHSYDNFYASQ